MPSFCLQSEEKYLEVKEYGKYHPDYRKYAQSFCEAKDKLFGLPLVQRYKELERLFQEKLNEVAEEIKESIKRQQVMCYDSKKRINCLF